MEIKEIIQGLDGSIFNEDMIKEIQKMFESAVDEKVKKAKKIMEYNYKKNISKIEAKHNNLNENIIKDNEKSLSIQKSKANAHLNKIIDRYSKKEKLNEKKLEKIKQDLIKEFKERENNIKKHFFMEKKQLQKEYSEIVDDILKEEVNNFVRENGELFEEALNISREKVLQESIKTTMKVSGNNVEVLKDVDGKDSGIIKKLKLENQKLKKELENYEKNSIFEKITKDMSISEKNNLKILSEEIKFIDKKQYEDKLKKMRNLNTNKHNFNKSFINENMNINNKEIIKNKNNREGGIYNRYFYK